MQALQGFVVCTLENGNQFAKHRKFRSFLPGNYVLHLQVILGVVISHLGKKSFLKIPILSENAGDTLLLAKI